MKMLRFEGERTRFANALISRVLDGTAGELFNTACRLVPINTKADFESPVTFRAKFDGCTVDLTTSEACIDELADITFDDDLKSEESDVGRELIRHFAAWSFAKETGLKADDLILLPKGSIHAPANLVVELEVASSAFRVAVSVVDAKADADAVFPAANPALPSGELRLRTPISLAPHTLGLAEVRSITKGYVYLGDAEDNLPPYRITINGKGWVGTMDRGSLTLDGEEDEGFGAFDDENLSAEDLEVDETEDESAQPDLVVPDVAIKLDFVLATPSMATTEVQAIGPGYSFDLPETFGRDVKIMNEGYQLGRGELIFVDDVPGVRVTDWFYKPKS